MSPLQVALTTYVIFGFVFQFVALHKCGQLNRLTIPSIFCTTFLNACIAWYFPMVAAVLYCASVPSYVIAIRQMRDINRLDSFKEDYTNAVKTLGMDVEK
jgi:Na+/H+-dicarboxylate symporter